MAGQKLRRLYEGVKSKGEYEAEWDGRSGRGEALPSGVYVLRMQSGARMQWRKMIILK